MDYRGGGNIPFYYIMAKKKSSAFRQVSNWLHLWLGLSSGIVVFVVCLTAAIWTFSEEMVYWFLPGQQVEQQEHSLKPSVLMQKCRDYVNKQPSDTLGYIYGLEYRDENQSAVLNYSDSVGGEYKTLFINPYTGEVLHKQSKTDGIIRFNLFLRAGHRFFWLPRPFGSYFVGTCSLIFLVTLITGLIWWYPAKWNRSTRNKSFKIKWDANWKRINLDLHNVLGFYTLIFTVILTVTGVAITFKWFDHGYSWVVTGGKLKPPYPDEGMSDTTLVAGYAHPDDEIWKRYKKFRQIKITYPAKPTDVYKVYIHPLGHNGLTTWHSFDQNSLSIIGGTGKQAELTLGQKIYVGNIDIHTGAIGHLPTKIIAALASLVGASLPVTGFILWYNRRFKKGKKRSK